MFSKLVDNWKARKAVKNLEQHPVYSLVLRQLRERLNDTSNGIGKHYSEEGKLRLMQKILTDIEQALAQPNPVQAVRMRFIDFMLSASKLDVLVMQLPTPFKYLSGALKPMIPELASKDKELEELFDGLNASPESFDDMWDAVLMRYWIMHLYMSCYNRVRMALDVYHSNLNKDWFKVAYISFCIWHEHGYRQLLGLPSLIEGENSNLKAVMFSTWINRAEEGHMQLRLAWEKSWEECFNEPNPFSGAVLDF